MNNKRPHSSVYGAPPQPAAPAPTPAQQPTMAGPQQPGGATAGGQPDYSAAWAAYYAQQGQAAAAAQAAMAPQQQHHQPQAGYPHPQPNAAYPYQQPAAPQYASSPYQPQPQQAPYGAPQNFRPLQNQPGPHPYQPSQHQGQQQSYAPNPQPNYPAVAPMQGFPPQQGFQSSQQAPYQNRPPIPPNQRGPGGPPLSGPGPSQQSSRPPYNAPIPQQSPQGGFPPAKRQRFDQPGPSNGGGGWDRDRDDRGGPSAGGYSGPGGGYGLRPSAGRPPMDEGINAMPIGGGSMNPGPARNDRGGSEYFGGSNDGRDGMGMGSRGGRGGGGAYVDRMDRGGSIRGGRGGGRGGYGDDRYDESYGDSSRGGYAARSRGRGLSRLSPPPALGRGGSMAARGDRGSFRGGRGRGGVYNAPYHNTPDAPRGPSKTRGLKNDKDSSSTSGPPFSSVNTIDAKSSKKDKAPEEKRTVTDFKIVGLELPELSWKWGAVPEKEREEEGKKRKADGSEAGDSANDPEALPHPSKHRTSYFVTHGKGTTEAPDSANKDMNRLRIYFDSPAGSGSGEKRGRGGIEGLRVKPGKSVDASSARGVSLAPSEAPSNAAATWKHEENGEVREPSAEEREDEDEEELDGEPMDDATDVSKQANGENDGEEDVVEALATGAEEADTTKPTPLSLPEPSPTPADAPSEAPAGITELLIEATPPPPETSAPNDDASIAAASLDLPEVEDVGDVSMASARSSAEPEAASAALENGTTLSETVASDKAPIEQVSSSVIPTDPTSTEATSEHPEPPPSPRKAHPYTDAPIFVNSSRSPSPTTSHLAAEHHPAPESAPLPSPKPSHVAPTAQELREEKTTPIYTGPEPSPNRISILYQHCTRRLCIDAEVVERVRVSRAEGKVEFTIQWRKGEKPKPVVKAVDIAPASLELAHASVPASTGPMSEPAVEESVKEEGGVEGQIKNEPASPMKISSPVKGVKQEESEVAAPAVAEPAEDPTKKAREETDASEAEKSNEKEDARTWDICRGILMEEMKDLDSADAQFQPITLEGLHDLYDDVTDPSSFGWTPPIHNLISPTSPPDAPYPELKTDTFKVIAYLDRERPLSEPKWIKTGNVEDWLSEIFGPLEGGKGLGWRGKFEILDPEPVQAPTIATVLDSWAMNSTVGAARDRRKFKNNHILPNSDNVFEILLRLVRGSDRPNGIALSSLTGPLAAAVSPNSHYAGAQNHVSLAVVAMLKLTKEMADKAGVKSSVVDEKIADIIRSIPQHLFFKSVDAMFRESQKDKK